MHARHPSTSECRLNSSPIKFRVVLSFRHLFNAGFSPSIPALHFLGGEHQLENTLYAGIEDRREATCSELLMEQVIASPRPSMES